MKLLPVLLTTSLLAACMGPPRKAFQMTQQPLIGGTTDSGDSSVVALLATTNQGQALCTSSLIAPTVLLTAAHCVDPSETGSGARFDVVQGTNAQFGSQPTGNSIVSETHYDTAFDSNQLQNGHDIGIVILTHPLPLPTIPFNKSPVDQSMIGQPARLIGYGLSDAAAQSGAGTKRQLTTTLDDFDNLLLHIGDTGMDSCSGDSGGPALMKINGVETIMGVTSFGNQDCSGGGYYTRIDDYTSFIDQYLPACTPMCSGKGCGPDGCGGSCGTCANGESCTSAGQCMPVCTPQCSGKSCGSDGCGGTCGTCGSGQTCSSAGQCQSPQCMESEPNNSLPAANALCGGTQIEGSISSPGDVDWYSFTLPESTQYTVHLTHLSADMTISLYKILNSAVTWLGDAPNNHDQADQSISRDSATGGTYYLRVQGVNGSSSGNPYQVQISFP
jgi:secreted trypsin-like serine protease